LSTSLKLTSTFSFLFFPCYREGNHDPKSSHLPLASVGSGRSSSLLSFSSFFIFYFLFYYYFCCCLARSFSSYHHLDEVLFIVLYDLSRMELQPQCFDFSITPFTFAAVLPSLVAGFVKVLRSDFLKARSTFFRWPLPPTHLSTSLTSVPNTRRHWPCVLQPSTHQRVAPTRWNAVLTCWHRVSGPWAFLLLICFFFFFFSFFFMVLGLLFLFGRDSCIWIYVGISLSCSLIFKF